MIEPGHGIAHGFDRLNVRQNWPAQHDHRQAECARRRDLAVGRGAAAVLDDDYVDAMLFQDPAFIGFVERTAAGDIDRMRHREWRDHRLDAAHHIVMLRCVGKRLDFLATERKEDAARCVAKRQHGARHVVNFDPAIRCNRGPARPTQSKQRDPRPWGGVGRVRRNHGRIRMRRIDENTDLLVDEIIRQTFSTAKTADPQRNGLQHGSSRAARERKRHGKVGPLGQAFGQLPRLRGAAENEDSHVAR